MSQSIEIVKRAERVKLLCAQLSAELEQIQLDADRIANGHVCHLPEVKLIQEIVSAHFGLSPQVMMSATRTAPFVNARAIAIFLCRQITSYTAMEIGMCFGGREHSSVIYAFSCVVEKMEASPALLADIRELDRSCRERISKAGIRSSLIGLEPIVKAS